MYIPTLVFSVKVLFEIFRCVLMMILFTVFSPEKPDLQTDLRVVSQPGPIETPQLTFAKARPSLPSSFQLQSNQSIASMQQEPLVITRDILELANMSIYVSVLPSRRNVSDYRDQFDYFDHFEVEPDGALIAGALGRCIVAFRPTLVPRVDDFYQNLMEGTEQICPRNSNSAGDCCSVRTGWHQAYYTEYRKRFEESLQKCASTCQDPNSCVVLTGMSQGANIAAVAAVALADMNPIVMLFGQAATLHPGCTSIDSSRWYRWVNTGPCTLMGIPGMVYDFPTFILDRGEKAYGHMILLSDDPTSVAHVGLDAQDYDVPWLPIGFAAHVTRRGEQIWGRLCYIGGYRDRLEQMLAHYDAKVRDSGVDYTIRHTGFAGGIHCTRDFECSSNKCVGAVGRRPGLCADQYQKE